MTDPFGRYEVELVFDNNREIILENVSAWRVEDLRERMSIGEPFPLENDKGFTYCVNPDKITYMAWRPV